MFCDKNSYKIKGPKLNFLKGDRAVAKTNLITALEPES